MISDIQKRKLKRLYGVLDFDDNGYIEESDFTSIGENLCILWGLDEDTEEHISVMGRFSEAWKQFSFHTNNVDEGITWESILQLADKFFVKKEGEQMSRHIEEFVGEIFDKFDSNGDGFISLNEYFDFFMAYRIEIR